MDVHIGGDFRNGVAEGIGTYTYKNNDIYKGHFLNNKKEGKGVLYYKDGSKYIGMWKDNLKCGNGKLIKSNGDIYIENFQMIKSMVKVNIFIQMETNIQGNLKTM